MQASQGILLEGRWKEKEVRTCSCFSVSRAGWISSFLCLQGHFCRELLRVRLHSRTTGTHRRARPQPPSTHLSAGPSSHAFPPLQRPRDPQNQFLLYLLTSVPGSIVCAWRRAPSSLIASVLPCELKIFFVSCRRNVFHCSWLQISRFSSAFLLLHFSGMWAPFPSSRTKEVLGRAGCLCWTWRGPANLLVCLPPSTAPDPGSRSDRTLRALGWGWRERVSGCPVWRHHLWGAGLRL